MRLGLPAREGVSFVAAVLLFWLATAAGLEAQTRKVRVAVPGYTIAVLSFLAAKANSYPPNRFQKPDGMPRYCHASM